MRLATIGGVQGCGHATPSHVASHNRGHAESTLNHVASGNLRHGPRGVRAASVRSPGVGGGVHPGWRCNRGSCDLYGTAGR
jgi:hypothetical protein